MVLVDDDPLLRIGLKTIVESDDEIVVVGEAGDGEEAQQVVRELAPDVVLMDLGMPRMNGIEATRAIVQNRTAGAVLVLTVWDGNDEVTRAIDAGASGYLLKVASPDQIKNAVKAVHGGDAVLSPQVTRQLLERMSLDRTDGKRRDARRLVDLLSDRERAVAAELTKGLSNAEIGKALFISPATVKTHITAIQNKLNVTGRVQIAVLMERAGVGD